MELFSQEQMLEMIEFFIDKKIIFKLYDHKNNFICEFFIEYGPDNSGYVKLNKYHGVEYSTFHYNSRTAKHFVIAYTKKIKKNLDSFNTGYILKCEFLSEKINKIMQL